MGRVEQRRTVKNISKDSRFNISNNEKGQITNKERKAIIGQKRDTTSNDKQYKKQLESAQKGDVLKQPKYKAMQITNEQVKKFQSFWKRDFKEDIDEKTAKEELLHFVNLIGLVYKPIKK